jgi:hypothetical protein
MDLELHENMWRMWGFVRNNKEHRHQSQKRWNDCNQEQPKSKWALLATSNAETPKEGVLPRVKGRKKRVGMKKKYP